MELILQGNVTMEDNILIGFANAIVGNTRLETDSYQSRITYIGVGALIHVLCNASSIEGIYTSNHHSRTLEGELVILIFLLIWS